MYRDLKQPITFSDQVKKLESKGVVINNHEQCETFLSRVNYYRFSGYLLPFRSSIINFDVVRDIYYFDEKMRNLVTFAIERIEVFIRTQIAYFFSHKYGTEGYLDKKNFNKKHNHEAFLEHFNRCIRDNKRSPVIIHHKNIYGGHYPLWAVIDYFSLGMLSRFYSDLKNPDKAYLAKSMYRLNYQTLSSWIFCLTILRNRCAHYARLYYWIFPSMPKRSKNDLFIPDRSLFSQLIMLKELYPAPDQWNREFFLPLYDLIDHYKESIQLKDIGFPDNWINILNRES